MNQVYLRAITAFLVIFLSCFFQLAHAVEVDKIIIFGDSLSDNGNLLSLTSKAHKVFPSVPVTPKNPPYYQGRFSNGQAWIDLLASSMNIPLLDYAYGGAWAEPLHDSRIFVPFGIGTQVTYYLVAAATDFHKDKHLYIIWAGGNDYVDGREDADYATTNTVASIETQIDWLAYYGGKNFMIINLPDLSVVPEVTSKGPDKIQQVDKLITLHNEKLQKMIVKMQKKYPKANIIYADITTYFNDTYHHPEKYNLKNVTTPCYTGEYSFMRNLINSEEIAAANEQHIDIMNNSSLRTAYMTSKLADSGVEPCSNPDDYMFWDQIHPTRVIHHLLALDAKNLLAQHDIQGANSPRS